MTELSIQVCPVWQLFLALPACLLFLTVPSFHAAAQDSGPITVPTLNLAPPDTPLAQYGPYNAHLLVGGRGLAKSLPANDPILSARTTWTLSAWVEFAPNPASSFLIAGAGDPTDRSAKSAAKSIRFFALLDGKIAFLLGDDRRLFSAAPFRVEGWHFLAATSDGTTVRFFIDGAEVAQRGLTRDGLPDGPISPQLLIAPVEPACAKLPCPHFGGRIAAFTLAHGTVPRESIVALAKEAPDPDLIEFEEGSKPWPIQVVQFAGNTAPQEPWTMPRRNAPFSQPVAAPLPQAQTTLRENSPRDWTLSGGWKLIEAPKTSASAQAISTAGFDATSWMPATVPGTVLTTMIDRGLYPDPDFGLNNLAIPEKLNRQDYWYRAEFLAPDSAQSTQFSLRFDGINYRAEVWLNGQRLGEIAGAFTRGSFDVTDALRNRRRNALAVRVSPAPHHGIPNVQSIAFGAGLNGGAMELDGPTFMASEGWDWNPPMRDRDSGLWQDVHLVATGPVSIGDQQVITHLALPDIAKAELTLKIPLTNDSNKPLGGKLKIAFEGVELDKQVVVPPGGLTVQLASAEFPELRLQHPRLWWPNGYGSPELYHLTTTFATVGAAPVVKKLHFGVREISYEISLLDNQGQLRRVDYDPTVGRLDHRPQVDVTHEGMRQVPGGWAASIAAGQDASPVFHTLDDTRATPFLAIKVNGVRIAVRGGSWGMDDSRKRVSRERLEPFFRYERDGNLNTIRNWQGQNTEEVFYDLADEYGFLVWNDFWEVTTNSNAEPEDPQLFLANARDTIQRYRNHPSIAVWCGRNEGVPQPIVNQGLIALTHSLDGTRYYSPSSNEVNLLPSGPYSYQEPADYSSKLDRGFAVEVGTSSLPTLEWFDRWLPKEDHWPISDDWAYHNWHPNDAFRDHREAQFGKAESLEEYERQAQMMNYVDYRAIFEGFNAHLWAPNTGRLLWMTQPSWPSMLWGILSSDYATQASYYATKKACEPLHVQLDLATDDVQLINTTREPMHEAKVDADVYALDSKLLLHREVVLDAPADDVAQALHLDLAPLLGDSTVLVHLALHDSAGALLSENLYWRAASDAGYRALQTLPKVNLGLQVENGPHIAGSAGSLDRTTPGRRITVHLKNSGTVAALNAKLTVLRTADSSEVLPAFYSDNYISLLPGQERDVLVDLPDVGTNRGIRLQLRGWNVAPAAIALPQLSQ